MNITKTFGRRFYIQDKTQNKLVCGKFGFIFFYLHTQRMNACINNSTIRNFSLQKNLNLSDLSFLLSTTFRLFERNCSIYIWSRSKTSWKDRLDSHNSWSLGGNIQFLNRKLHLGHFVQCSFTSKNQYHWQDCWEPQSVW